MSGWRAKVDRRSLRTRDRPDVENKRIDDTQIGLHEFLRRIDDLEARAQSKSEWEFVVEQHEVALTRLRELLRRIDQRRPEAGDYPVFAAIVAKIIAEAGDREILTIEIDGADEDRRGSVVDAGEPTLDGEGRTSAAGAESELLSSGGRRRG